MLGGNVFDATIPSTPGANTVTVAATDLNGNTTTKSWTVTIPADSATYAYDSNGNLAQKVEGSTTWTYEWNAENQLTRVLNNGSEVARYKYDPVGRRGEKVIGATTTAYVADGVTILRETGSGTTLLYVHGPEIRRAAIARAQRRGLELSPRGQSRKRAEADQFDRCSYPHLGL